MEGPVYTRVLEVEGKGDCKGYCLRDRNKIRTRAEGNRREPALADLDPTAYQAEAREIGPLRCIGNSTIGKKENR